ncbi:MAG: HD domain-containing protein [Promethearchaeota archaeon]
MSDDKLILLIKNHARLHSEQDDIHGFPHVERVYQSCMEMGKKLNANLFILKISALLHDIGRMDHGEIFKGKNHAEISAEMAKKFFKWEKIEFPEKILNNILHCIRAHSFSNNIPANTLEAKILSDCDKLDALGAIGIYRTIGFTIRNGGRIEDVIRHLENKILKLKDLLYLDYSKQLAKSRHDMIKHFYEELIKDNNRSNITF